jgi:hypothetical protein
MKRAILLLALAGWFVVAACSRDEPQEVTGHLEKQNYETRIETSLEALDRSVEELRRDAAVQGAGARAEVQEAIAELDQERELLENRLLDLKQEGESSWRGLRDQMDRDLAELERKYSRVRAQL